MHFMHSVFAESLNVFQVKDSGSQNHNMHFFFVPFYHVWI